MAKKIFKDLNGVQITEAELNTKSGYSFVKSK